MRKIVTVLLFSISCLLCSVAMAQDDKPRLGLSVTTFDAPPILLQHLKLSEGEGVMIRNVAVGGDLEAAGLSQGDILLAIDGHPTNRPQDLTDYVSSLPHGTKVTLDVIQKGDHHQVYAVLDNLPDEVTWMYSEPSRRERRIVNPFMRMRNQGGNTAPQRQLTPRSGSNAVPPLSMGSATTHVQSFVQTPQGVEQVSATISGDPANPDSMIEMTVNGNKYVSKIGEIDQLPDEARQAAKQILNKSGNFSFSFSFGGASMLEDLINQQREQMEELERMFFNQGFSVPFPQGTPSPSRPAPPQPGSGTDHVGPLRIVEGNPS